MMRLVAVILFSCGLGADLAPAQNMDPEPLLPANFRWLNPPDNPSLQAAWVIGSERNPGPYILRVKLAHGGKIPPHKHPDERTSTVLAGTLHVAFGEDFQESRVVAIPAGAVYVTPPNTPHYVWAREGNVVYQEAGVGPTGTSFIKPK
jgi:quercetin dioxygenase-like cupin family protein